MSNLQTVRFEPLGLSKIFIDYISGNENLLARFPGNPFELENSLKVADMVRTREYPRQEIVTRLVDYNQELGAGEATLRNIDALKKPDTFVVCAGQQPTIFTGPLFNIYKAVTCLVLARRLTAMSEKNTFVPVFWCASEDHDLEEMNRVYFPDPQGDIQKLKIDLTNDGRPAEGIRVDRQCQKVLKEAVELLPDSEFKDEVLAIFEPEPGDTLGTWFNRILVGLFSDDGLVVLEPHLIRDLAAPVIQKELESSDDSSRLLKEAGGALTEMGYDPAFDGDRKLHCFFMGNRRRSRIEFYADFCILGEDRVDKQELPFHLEEHPEQFSPDAALRPVVQGSVLPVTTYVAGPGEAAYYAQLKEMHSFFGVPMPVIYPRASVTLVENSMARCMEKFKLEPAQLFLDPEGQESLLESSSKGKELAASLDKHIEQSLAQLASIESEVSGVNDGVARVVKKVSGRINREFAYLKRRITEALDEAEGVGKRQLSRLFANTFPKSKPQERVFNVLYFLVKYGPDLPRGLIQNLQEDTNHHIIYLLKAFVALEEEEERPEEIQQESGGQEDGQEDDESAPDDAGDAEGAEREKEGGEEPAEEPDSETVIPDEG